MQSHSSLIGGGPYKHKIKSPRVPQQPGMHATAQDERQWGAPRVAVQQKQKQKKQQPAPSATAQDERQLAYLGSCAPSGRSALENSFLGEMPERAMASQKQFFKCFPHYYEGHILFMSGCLLARRFTTIKFKKTSTIQEMPERVPQQVHP